MNELTVGVGVWTTTDGATWQQADLPADAHVNAFATDGEVVVAAATSIVGARQHSGWPIAEAAALSVARPWGFDLFVERFRTLSINISLVI